MPRKHRRNEWTNTKHGGWARSMGERGLRVRLFQNRRGGTFYRAVWMPGAGKDVASLRTTDRDEAQARANALYATLLQGKLIAKSSVITLERLWDRYRQESPRFAASTVSTQKDAKTQAEILMAFLGANFDVARLTDHDVRRYEAARRAGGIKRNGDETTRAVRARTADADLVLLKTMLRWATTVREPTGERWLKENPLYGFVRSRESNPKRPIATWERFTSTRGAMQRLASAASTETERVRWVRMELALVLAECTGRRLGSIRQLQWEDIDLEKPSIRWRWEADKKRRESVIPLIEEQAADIRQLRTRLGAIAGWVFPRESDGEAPMDRHLFDKWLSVAEKVAGLPKLDGGLWHPYRRKWATERKDYSLKDVAAAGGWKDVGTLLECYQQPDDATLLEVMGAGLRKRNGAPPPDKRKQKRKLHVG